MEHRPLFTKVRESNNQILGLYQQIKAICISPPNGKYQAKQLGSERVQENTWLIPQKIHFPCLDIPT